MPKCFNCGASHFVRSNNLTICSHCELKLRICSFCDCDELVKQANGWLVCTQCNSVDESYQEYELDWEDHSSKAKRAIASGENVTSQTVTNKLENADNEKPWTILEAFQVFKLGTLVYIYICF